MITVILYYQKNCEGCEETLEILHGIKEAYPHHLVKIDIDSDPVLKGNYQNKVPFIQIGPYRLSLPFSRQEILVALGAASDREKALKEIGDDAYLLKLQRGHSMTGTDRFSFWLTRHYMWLFNFVFLLYVGLPFLAPVLMRTGATGPAKVIYTVYSPLCHQLAFRSWFLFGEQAYYPRELAGISGVLTYEKLTNQNTLDLTAARQFIGNSVVGYKVALCERDVAIYGAMLLFGIVFAVTGRKIHSIPWYLWLVLGLIPIGLDGGSQLTGLMQNILPNLPIYRESTPFLRTLTGGMFGVMTAWYIYPLIEEAMAENRRILLKKIAIAEQTSPQNG
jgi:uncharacterized membrane protein